MLDVAPNIDFRQGLLFRCRMDRNIHLSPERIQEQPTDHYIRPLYQLIEEAKNNGACLGNEAQIKTHFR